MAFMSIVRNIFSPGNALYAGAKKSRKLPHILTAVLLPPFILIVCSLIGGIIYKIIMPESLTRSSLSEHVRKYRKRSYRLRIPSLKFRPQSPHLLFESAALRTHCGQS